MRINFVLPDVSLGGGTRVVAMHAEHLRRRGHKVTVICTPRQQPFLREQIKSLLKGRGWPTAEPASSHFDNLQVERRVIDSCRPISDRDVPDADVVVATWWETAEWVARLSPSKGAKAYFIQDLESLFHGQPVDRVEATWRLPMQKIVISKWLDGIARERFGDFSSMLVPNAVDTDLFHGPPRGKQPRPTVGFLYAPKVPHKSTATALAVVEGAARHVPGLHVRAFGTGSVIAEAPLPPGSDYTQRPPQHRLREIYTACDAWLCTSTSEGWGLPPHEAMACRCPVISTKVAGPVTIIEDGVSGYLLDVGDTTGLISRLVEVLTLPEAAWRRMSDAAYESVSHYTWDEATALFEQALAVAVERFGSDTSLAQR